MRKVLFLIISVALIVSFSACKKSDLTDESTTMTDAFSTENSSSEITVPAAGTDLSVDEIVDLYNDSISNASQVTRVYTHARYENFTLSAEAFESTAKNVLDDVVKNNDVEYQAVQKSEIEEILPKPCLDKAKIKEYENSDGNITLYLYDIENPTDEDCIKLYSTSFLSGMFEKYNFAIDGINLSYTDCRIDFKIDENKNVTDMSYSWKVNACGNFELLFKTQSFGIDICVEESFKFQM